MNARIVITKDTELYKTMTREQWANMLKVAANKGWIISMEGQHRSE